MKNKIFRRFYLLNIITVVVAMIMLMVMISVSVSNYLTKEKRSLLAGYCRAVSDAFDMDLSEGGVNYYMRTIILTGDVIDADAIVVDATGRVKYCTCRDWQGGGSCPHLGKTISTSVVNAAVNGQYYGVGLLEGMYTEVHHTVGMPVKDKYNRVVGAVFASTPAALLEEWLINFSKISVLCAILPLVLTCVVVYIYTSHMLRPLRMMSEAAKCLADGDFSKRIYCDGDDEIAELANSFNTMTDSLVRLESMRRSFVANVSHELRTPITTIGGFIDGILDGTIEPEKQSYYLGIVSDEAKRLSRIVRSMLSLSKLESGEQEINRSKVNMFETACNVFVSQEQRISAKNIAVYGLEDEKDVIISADSDLFHQVVYNLVDNAVKFTPENGYIKVKFRETDKSGVFIIRNSGNGISEKDLPLVFERFFKVDKSRSMDKQSSGLGLYIVKSIIDLHGGTITVRSMQGEYTEFEIDMPLAEPKEAIPVTVSKKSSRTGKQR